MEMTIIGIDPHKRSHTAVVLDDTERIDAEIRVAAGPQQAEQLVAWHWPGRGCWPWRTPTAWAAAVTPACWSRRTGRGRPGIARGAGAPVVGSLGQEDRRVRCEVGRDRRTPPVAVRVFTKQLRPGHHRGEDPFWPGARLDGQHRQQQVRGESRGHAIPLTLTLTITPGRCHHRMSTDICSRTQECRRQLLTQPFW